MTAAFLWVVAVAVLGVAAADDDGLPDQVRDDIRRLQDSIASAESKDMAAIQPVLDRVIRYFAPQSALLSTTSLIWRALRRRVALSLEDGDLVRRLLRSGDPHEQGFAVVLLLMYPPAPPELVLFLIQAAPEFLDLYGQRILSNMTEHDLVQVAEQFLLRHLVPVVKNRTLPKTFAPGFMDRKIHDLFLNQGSKSVVCAMSAVAAKFLSAFSWASLFESYVAQLDVKYSDISSKQPIRDRQRLFLEDVLGLLPENEDRFVTQAVVRLTMRSDTPRKHLYEALMQGVMAGEDSALSKRFNTEMYGPYLLTLVNAQRLSVSDILPYIQDPAGFFRIALLVTDGACYDAWKRFRSSLGSPLSLEHSWEQSALDGFAPEFRRKIGDLHVALLQHPEFPYAWLYRDPYVQMLRRHLVDIAECVSHAISKQPNLLETGVTRSPKSRLPEAPPRREPEIPEPFVSIRHLISLASGEMNISDAARSNLFHIALGALQSITADNNAENSRYIADIFRQVFLHPLFDQTQQDAVVCKFLENNRGAHQLQAAGMSELLSVPGTASALDAAECYCCGFPATARHSFDALCAPAAASVLDRFPQFAPVLQPLKHLPNLPGKITKNRHFIVFLRSQAGHVTMPEIVPYVVSVVSNAFFTDAVDDNVAAMHVVLARHDGFFADYRQLILRMCGSVNLELLGENIRGSSFVVLLENCLAKLTDRECDALMEDIQRMETSGLAPRHHW